MGATTLSTLNACDLTGLLMSLRGATVLSFTARTDARLKKTGNPWGRVWKVAKLNGMVNFRYDEGVLRRLEKEGKSPDCFERGDSWHEPIMDGDRLTPLCRHKQTEELYLRFMLVKRVGEASYETDDGVPLTEEEVKPFLPKPSTYANQGLDKPLVFLTYRLDGIREIRIDGETFAIDHDEAATVPQVRPGDIAGSV